MMYDQLLWETAERGVTVERLIVGLRHCSVLVSIRVYLVNCDDTEQTGMCIDSTEQDSPIGLNPF